MYERRKLMGNAGGTDWSSGLPGFPGVAPTLQPSNPPTLQHRFLETGDEDELRRVWDNYEAALDVVGAALDAFRFDEANHREHIADEPEAYLKSRFATGGEDNMAFGVGSSLRRSML